MPALELLMNHPFPGNIRELKTYLFDAVARCNASGITDRILAERLGTAETALHTVPASLAPPERSPLEALFGHFPTLDELVAVAVKQALDTSGNNQSQAARLLGISKQALNKRLRKERSR